MAAGMTGVDLPDAVDLPDRRVVRVTANVSGNLVLAKQNLETMIVLRMSVQRIPDMSDSATDLADLARALVNLGFPKTAAVAKLERSRRAREARGAPLTEEEILRQALSG